MGAVLNPYLSFTGNAREAMEFYRDVLGGELNILTFAEGGAPHEPADGEKIMHSQLETPSGFTLMGADNVGDAAGESSLGVQISLSGDADTDAELSGYYERLASTGTVVEPLETAPWGDKFGMVTDQFGVLWMVNITGEQSD